MIAITGATGFLGSAVLRAALGLEQELRVLVRKNSDRSNIEGLDVEVVEGDLLDRGSLRTLLRGCSGLFHVAADYRLWAMDPEEIFRVNCAGTENIMLEAAEVGVNRIVYTSSVGTLGLVENGDADEETQVSYGDMIGAYKQSKFNAEKQVRELVSSQKVPIVIVNPSTPVGPRDIRPTPTGRMILEAASGRMPACVDTGLNIVHVDDVAEGHLLAHKSGEIGERYILGGENFHLSSLLTQISKITGAAPPLVTLPHSLVLPFGYVSETWARFTSGREPFLTVDGVKMARKKMFFSSNKAKEKLGYCPRPASQGISDAVDWFKETGQLAH